MDVYGQKTTMLHLTMGRLTSRVSRLVQPQLGSYNCPEMLGSDAMQFAADDELREELIPGPSQQKNCIRQHGKHGAHCSDT